MKFTLTIKCDNEAFADDGSDWPGQGAMPEVGRILAMLARRIERDAAGNEGTLHDGNGNTVGSYSLD